MDAYKIQQEISRLINDIRIKEGLSPLSFNPLLTNIAELKNQSMLDSGSFSHEGFDGKYIWDYFDKNTYDFSHVGENLGMQFSTAKEVVDALMASPTHKENILKKEYKDIGYSVMPKDGKYMLSQIFAVPKESKDEQYVYNPETKDVLAKTTGTLQDWANYGYSPISQERYNQLGGQDQRLTKAIDIEAKEKIAMLKETPSIVKQDSQDISIRLSNIMKTGSANPTGRPNRAFTNALYLEYHKRNATDNEFKRFDNINIKDTANIIAGKEIIK